MKAFRATYTPISEVERRDRSTGALVYHSMQPRTVRVIAILGPDIGGDRHWEDRVVFIDSNNNLAMDGIYCFTNCQWEDK